jgi:hypothetical protein
MASKRRLRRKMCEAKRRYGSRKEAENVKERVKRQAGGFLNSYCCRFCHGWHIGHVPGFVRRAMAARYA